MFVLVDGVSQSLKHTVTHQSMVVITICIHNQSFDIRSRIYLFSHRKCVNATENCIEKQVEIEIGRQTYRDGEKKSEVRYILSSALF